MRDTLPAFLRHAAAKRRPRTVKTYGAVLELLFDSLTEARSPTWPPTPAEIDGFLARPRRDGVARAAATRNQELAALRVYAAFAKRDLGWQADPTADMAFIREPRRIPPVLTVDELQRSFRAVAAELRPEFRTCNLAILALLSQTGPRVHELVQLNLDQVDLATGTVLGVEGKGGTLRELPLNDRARALLAGWVKERPKYAAPSETAFFVSTRGTRISIRTVERRIQCLRELMGLAKKATPHTFRHTFATLELLAGTDIATLADLLGHENINTTALYLHWIDFRRREAVRKISHTIPAEVLPPAESIPAEASLPPKPVVPEPRQAPVSPRPFDLDDQHGLVAAA
jgi:site-specific recombinase XerC